MQTTTEMELVPANAGENAKQIAPFDSFKAEVERLKVTAETLTVSRVDDKAGMKLARATRLALRDVRIAVEHRRKELGEEHLKAKQKVDGDAKALKDAIEPLEARLEDQEKFIEREEARIRAEKQAARIAEVTPFLIAPLTFDLGALPDEQWATVLAGAKAEHDARLQKIEDDRIAAEAEKARIEAQRVENERLKAETAALEKKLADERAEADAKLKAEREALEAKVKAEADAREALERAERDRKAKEASDEKARIAAEKKAKAAPDKAKAQALADAIRAFPLPEFADAKLGEAVHRARSVFAETVEARASEL
jgi:colicin import membrane protein